MPTAYRHEDDLANSEPLQSSYPVNITLTLIPGYKILSNRNTEQNNYAAGQVPQTAWYRLHPANTTSSEAGVRACGRAGIRVGQWFQSERRPWIRRLAVPRRRERCRRCQWGECFRYTWDYFSTLSDKIVYQDVDQQYRAYDDAKREKLVKSVIYAAYPKHKRTPAYVTEAYDDYAYQAATTNVQRKPQDYNTKKGTF